MTNASNPSVESLLRDCVAADPSLKGREDEVRPIIAALLESRPDTHFNEHFAAELRERLTTDDGFVTSSTPNEPSFMRPTSLIYLIPAGAFAATLVAVALVGPFSSNPAIQNQEGSVTSAPSARLAVATLGDNAFGSLIGSSVPGSTPENVARPQIGGGGGVAVSMSARPPMMVTTDAKMIAPGFPVPEAINYTFVYDGEPLALNDSVGVLRRVKGIPGTGSIANTLKGITGGLADLSSMQSATLASYSIVEDREFGYSAYIDAIEGTVQLSQNWQRWPHPESQCRDEVCYQQYRLNMGDVPSDDEIITIANAFLDEYGISREMYGTPEVNNQWRPLPAAATSEIWVPDTISLVYPLVIDGVQVNDDAGMPSGLTVNVNVRHKRVDGIWGLSTTEFQKSNYVGETDQSRILSVLSRGGAYGGWYGETTKTAEVRVGTPDIVLRRTWVAGANGTSEELLVPSLRFPVINPPQGLEWRTSIIVPLAKELLDEMFNMPNPMPMPLMMEDTAGGSASGSGTTTPAVQPEVANPPVLR